MGCDGGSIPTRCELVKTKKKEERADPNEVTRVKWTLCALSKEPLTPPIVVCPQGQLFNKEAILVHLLQKTIPAAFSYIKGMKDLIELNWSENPSWGKVEAAARFACPVTGIEANGRHGGFSVLRTCGCVLSERALREVPSTECLQCHKPFASETDVLPLNPPPEVAEQLLREWTVRQQSLRKSKKKAGSKKKAAAEASSASTTTTAAAADGEVKAEEDKASPEARKRKISGLQEDGDKAKSKKKTKDGDKASVPLIKKQRLTTSTTSTTTKTTTPALPAVATTMSKAVYDSIFIPSGQRRKQSTFTHYG